MISSASRIVERRCATIDAGAAAAAEVVVDRLLRLGVERARRLVEDQDARVDRRARGRSRAAAAGRRRGCGRPRRWSRAGRRAAPSRRRRCSASFSAAISTSSGTVSSQSVRLSRTLPSNRKMSWSTTESDAASTCREISSRGRPSSSTAPDHGSCSPAMMRAIVDLPLPEPPTSATRWPGSIESEKSRDQRLGERAVAERDLVEGEVALQPRALVLDRLRERLRDRVAQDVAEPVDVGADVLELLAELGELLHRPVEVREQALEGDEHADRDRALDRALRRRSGGSAPRSARRGAAARPRAAASARRGAAGRSRPSSGSRPSGRRSRSRCRSPSASRSAGARCTSSRSGGRGPDAASPSRPCAPARRAGARGCSARPCRSRSASARCRS